MRAEKRRISFTPSLQDRNEGRPMRMISRIKMKGMRKKVIQRVSFLKKEYAF
jgi:hypothetical protein